MGTRWISKVFVLAVLVAALGCGDDPMTETDGGLDAGVVPLDAAIDAGIGSDAELPLPDGGLDAGVDAGPPPVTCVGLSDEELLAVGYEPVRAHGATGDGETDDTAAIQSAIDTANRERHVVYFHPGEYLISDTLWLRQDDYEVRANDNEGRYGQVLQGSYCGARPTLRLADGTAPETDARVISGEPLAMILLMRNQDAGDATTPDNSYGGRDWNQTVRNLHLVLGDNPGAVGIRHKGAEGSSAQEVSIDARGGFAGFYQLNSSGGYTYDVEVRGGRYGLYLPSFRGGSPVVVGLRLREQTELPIAFSHYGPITFVGFEIEATQGPVIGMISGRDGNHSVAPRLRANGDSGGHVAFIDGQIDIAGEGPAIHNTERSVYLEDVYFRGVDTIVENEGGNLGAESTEAWSHVREYSYATTYGGPSRLVGGAHTQQSLLDGTFSPRGDDLRAALAEAGPSEELRQRHLYPTGLCNVEASNVVFAADHGASPDDDMNDTAALQSAIDEASATGGVVFLSAGAANDAGAIPGAYRIRGTLELASNTRLCGVTRYSSVLSAVGWTPSRSRPVVSTPDDVEATTTIADFKIVLPAVGGDYRDGYDPYPYAIHWQAGRRSLVRDVYYQLRWGERGDRRSVVIDGSGGGRWWGVTQHGGALPPLDGDARPYTDSAGRLVMSPDAAHMLIQNTTEPLTFYMYHAQHMTQPRGALTWIQGASNVRFLGIKSEMGSIPERMAEIIRGNPAELCPIWMSIQDSEHIQLVGHETLAQTASGRGLIEIRGGSDVSIVHYGRRDGAGAHAADPESSWFFVEENDEIGIRGSDFLSLYQMGE